MYEGNANNSGQQAPVHLPVEPNPYMALEEGYRWLAIQLKTATRGSADRLGIPRVESISDFEYVEFAIFFSANFHTLFQRPSGVLPSVEHDLMELMVDRIASMQSFRAEYEIRDDTVQEGVDAIRVWMNQHPQVLLHIANDFGHPDATRRGCLMICDGAAIDFQVALDNWKTFIVGRYFLQKTLFPHFGAMKRGNLEIFETKGMARWDQLLPYAKFVRKLHDEFKQFYPGTMKGLQIYHAPSLVRTIYSMSKRFMAPHILAKYQIDLQMHPDLAARYNRLTDLFAMNSTDVILRNVTDMLTERQINMEQFVL